MVGGSNKWMSIAGFVAGGKNTRTVVPTSGSLSNEIAPPVWAMIPWTVERPSPVPLSPSFVVNGEPREVPQVAGWGGRVMFSLLALWTMVLEMYGHWPWQRSRPDGTKPRTES